MNSSVNVVFVDFRNRRKAPTRIFAACAAKGRRSSSPSAARCRWDDVGVVSSSISYQPLLDIFRKAHT